MLDKNKKQAFQIESILKGNDGKYGYLFPLRENESVPTVAQHPFRKLASSKEDLNKSVIRIMLDLNYIAWTAKAILNIELIPFQITILKTLFTKAFPMLIASRGGSKCIRGDTLCKTSHGLLQINEIIDPESNIQQPLQVNCLMYGENGYKKSSYGWNNGVSKTKKIKLRSGIEIEATNNHPIRCVDNNGKIIWKNAEEIQIGDFVPIDRSQYDFGNDTTTSQDLAWWLGLMIGDGMFTQRGRLCLSSMNESIIKEFSRITEQEFDYKPKTIARPGQYNIYNVNIWDKLNDLYQTGNKNSYTKEIPILIRRSPRNVIAAFIRGLFDADACISKNRARIVYVSCSEKLVKQIQQSLLGFGIISTIKIRLTKSQNGTVVKSYSLIINNEYNIALYKKYIGFVCDHKQARLINRRIKKNNPNNDVVYNIRSILLDLRDKFDRHTGGPNKKNKGKKNVLICSSHVIKQYNLSYDKLRKFLDDINCISEDADWKYLNDLCNKRYYFDCVDSIEDSQCQTFDVNIPDDHSFVSNGLISHNSFLLAVYCILRALLDPGVKIVIVGAGLRQAKLVFNYIESIWSHAPVLRSIIGSGKRAGPKFNIDACYFRIGESIISAYPLGDGTKIRGLRANVVIADEFASIPEEIFNVVVKGFASTAKDPISKAKSAAINKRLKKLNISKNTYEMLNEIQKLGGNQIIYSGTAYYAFNHFAQTWRRWREIIYSRGNREALAKIFGGEHNIPKDFNYKDYAVIRLPATHIQEGLLDPMQLANAKATLPKSIYLMEFSACFVKDSEGFYPRSLIEACTCSPSKTIQTPDGEITFSPLMRKREGAKYVIGIDPAAERDNLAVLILEIWQSHARVVYCWAVNKPEFKNRKKRGLITDDDYYCYCASKIRALTKAFKPIRIEMDSQGGGYAMAELLRNKKLLNHSQGEFPIYEIIDRKDPKSTDLETDGPHILHLIAQSNDWNQQANVCMHKSMEMKHLLFPAFDTVKMQAALSVEKALNVTFDTFEDNVANIEELKNELCTIQMTQTPTGKEKFDTPAVILPGAVEGRKRTGHLRKDRYSALLFAHRYFYDQTVIIDDDIDYEDVAGNIKCVPTRPDEGMYRGRGTIRMQNADWSKRANTGAIKNKKVL